VGLNNQPGGRMGDSYSTLSDWLKEQGFEVGRFKTGTPCRLNGRSLDFKQCSPQPGDADPQPFSFVPDRLEKKPGEIFSLNHWKDGVFHVEQVPCWMTHTNARTHQHIRDNLHKSPLYAGKIEGVGPRYCPSIEDKVVRFAEKESHQIFLEPEGLHTEEYYVNGVSTSLPLEVQYDFLHSIPGLENAEILRPGYAVEYDYCPPTQLHSTLETQHIPRLYFAGQLNGTSGYEEAAAQGLVAGANAALQVAGKPPLLLGRSDAYIGVLIDDLVTKGTPEPYRMFTSRAEHRLLLRHDNADLRLTHLGQSAGLLDSDRIQKVETKTRQISALHQFLEKTAYDGIRLHQWLKRPENHPAQLPSEILGSFPTEIWGAVETELKYAGYIQRQNQSIDQLRKAESTRIPPTLDYSQIAGLRSETRQKLTDVKPDTLGQAGRISGITPADLALLSVYLHR
jgi:tRNA uridine 5-carboxymethylaminomethyl modification enzyme